LRAISIELLKADDQIQRIGSRKTTRNASRTA
jgi:hypothetical protein